MITKIIESKPWVHHKDCYPARIVLLKIYHPGRVEYSTHTQIYYESTNMLGFIWGHYFTTILEAANDFMGREI